MSERPFEVRDDLRSLAAYRAPQEEAAVRLNTNESPWPPVPAFADDLAARVRDLALHRYPDRDATALRAAIGARYGVDAAGVWVANGSNEILQTLLLAFGGPARRVLLFPPTYAMYDHAVRVTGGQAVARPVPEPWILEPEFVAAAVSEEQPAITLVCSPNNPTGNAQPLAAVEAALEAGDGLVVVDEAYGDFGGDSAVSLLARHNRLAVARSFSKSWRLAGARLGMLLASPWLVEALQVARLPYHLSALSQAAGEAALAHADALLAGVAEIVAERDRLAKDLERVAGVEVFPSDANFLLLRTPADAGVLWRGLAGNGVLVRDFSSLVPGCLRVTVGTPEQNATFVETLRRVMDAE